MPKTAICTLKSASPYSQSKAHMTIKLPQELPDDYEKRTWRERIHSDADGTVYIPCMAFANCIKEAAKFMSERIPGKGQQTWTKHFEAGILVMEHLRLPIKKDDVPEEWLYMNADGVRGSGKRVMRCYPRIESWKGKVTFHILDDTITEDAFERHLIQAGNLIGIGRFRPRNLGFYGRFEVVKVEWREGI